ncbi:hypothetical protein M885DRAFT_60269 [Pelagophyceae sp. CCMP2097]|nr:hypothetical protein M885DRAFT_60269 [Pelagophyceae sp. CCMP2097]
MTVFEAKGLEFDDVLLYNFFCDSPADKEWRVLYNHCDGDCDADADAAGLTGVAGLSGVSFADMAQEAPFKSNRCLDFDPDAHKLLESELKFLYTAVTRARVNVWIYDDSAKREPAFEFFRRRGLAESVTAVNGAAVDAADAADVGLFAKSTTPKEWLMRGDDFAARAAREEHPATQKGLLKVAGECLRRGGAPKRAARATAECAFLDAQDLQQRSGGRGRPAAGQAARSRARVAPQDVRRAFARAAEACVVAGLFEKGAVSLFLAREYSLAGELLEAVAGAAAGDAAVAAGAGNGAAAQKPRRAAGDDAFRAAAQAYKRADRDEDAARCYELRGDFEVALKLLRRGHFYLRALEVLERAGGAARPEHRELVYLAARRYVRDGATDRCAAALRRLPYAEQVDFLKAQPGCLAQLCALLCDHGDHGKASTYCSDRGDFDAALKCLHAPGAKMDRRATLRLEVAAARADLWDQWCAPGDDDASGVDDASGGGAGRARRHDAALARIVGEAGGRAMSAELHAEALELLGRCRGEAALVSASTEAYEAAVKARPGMRGTAAHSKPHVVRAGFHALLLLRDGRPVSAAAAIERCARLRGVAAELVRATTQRGDDGLQRRRRGDDAAQRRRADDAAAYFGLRELGGDDDAVEFAKSDARSKLLTAQLSVADSPTSAAHLRVDKTAVLARVGKIAAAVAVLLARDAATRVDAQLADGASPTDEAPPAPDAAAAVELCLERYALLAVLHKCSQMVHAGAAFMRAFFTSAEMEDLRLYGSKALIEAAAAQFEVATARLCEALRCAQRYGGEAVSSKWAGRVAAALDAHQGPLKTPFHQLARHVDAFSLRVAALGGVRPSLDEYLETIATLHLRSRRTGLHGPRTARKELLRALEQHEAAHARAKRSDLRHVVDADFLDARAGGLVLRASNLPAGFAELHMDTGASRWALVRLWDATTGALQNTQGHTHYYSCAATGESANSDPRTLRATKLVYLGRADHNPSLVAVGVLGGDGTVEAYLAPTSLTVEDTDAGNPEVYLVNSRASTRSHF